MIWADTTCNAIQHRIHRTSSMRLCGPIVYKGTTGVPTTLHVSIIVYLITHWCRDKRNDILQRALPHVFLEWRLGAEWARNNYLHQWWPRPLTDTCFNRCQWVDSCSDNMVPGHAPTNMIHPRSQCIYRYQTHLRHPISSQTISGLLLTCGDKKYWHV